MPRPSSPDLYRLVREDGRVVYHFGSLGPLPANGDPNKPYHLAPYQDGPLDFSLGHFWNSRATDRTACPIVIRKTPAEIIAAKRMFPYGDTGVPYGTTNALPYTLMGSSSLVPYMPTTGERPDIGLITDWSAWYMLKGDPVPMLEIAKAAESWPLHFRDEATGRPIDLLKYPKANCYFGSPQGSPWMIVFPPNPDKSPGAHPFAIGGGMVPQQAHFPEMSYMAYCATLDLGFLEELQFQANFLVCCDAIRSTSTTAIVSGEYRGLAWALRSLFMAHVATQDAEARNVLPAACHPSSYWKKLLDAALTYYSTFMNDPTNQYFRLIAGSGIFTPWQCDYMLTILSFAVLTGHSDWAPMYLWALKNAIDRGVGTRGYPLGMGGGPYFTTLTNWTDTLADYYKNTTDARFTQAQLNALTVNPFNGWTTIYDSGYHLTTRAVFVMAQYLDLLGLVPVKATYPELDDCFTNLNHFVKKAGYMVPRVSVVLSGGSPSPISVRATSLILIPS